MNGAWGWGVPWGARVQQLLDYTLEPGGSFIEQFIESEPTKYRAAASEDYNNTAGGSWSVKWYEINSGGSTPALGIYGPTTLADGLYPMLFAEGIGGWPVNVGDEVTFQGWFLRAAEDADGLRLRIIWHDSAGDYLSASSTEDVTIGAAEEWAFDFITRTAPASAAYCYPHISDQTWDPDGAVYLDDMRFTRNRGPGAINTWQII